MFLKYLIINIKHSISKYILLIICTIAVIIAAIAANGILMENLSWSMQYTTKMMELRFDEKQSVCEIRDKLYEVFNKIEPQFKYAFTKPVLSQEYVSDDPDAPEYGTDYSYEEEIAKTYGGTYFYWFPNYKRAKDFFTEIWNISSENFPTEEQYNSERVVVLGTGGEYYEKEPPHNCIRVPFKYTDENHVIIGGEEFLVTGRHSSYMSFAFFSGIPDDMLAQRIEIYFDDIPTTVQIENIISLVQETIGVDCQIEPPKTHDLLDIRKSTANIVITVIIQIIVVFNILIIYKFIIDSRKRQFAVMRLCGFKRSVCLMYLWGELILTAIICLPAAYGIFELIKPSFAKSYPVASVIYTPIYYAVLGMIFLASMTVVFAVYIIPTLGKTLSRELREM